MDVPCIRVGLLPLIFVVTYALCFSCGSSDLAKDREECTQQLAGLATCLPYVEGTAKAPTPDCCSGLKQVLSTNKKCLCVIIRDRNDPELGLTINTTLALGLPSVCNAPANVSKCPALLHLAPNSTEAQVFYQFGHASNNSTASVKGNATSAGSTGKSSPEKSDGRCSARVWLGFEVIVSGLLVWLFTSDLFMK